MQILRRDLRESAAASRLAENPPGVVDVHQDPHPTRPTPWYNEMIILCGARDIPLYAAPLIGNLLMWDCRA